MQIAIYLKSIAVAFLLHGLLGVSDDAPASDADSGPDFAANDSATSRLLRWR
jgi:hypothetical protein